MDVLPAHLNRDYFRDSFKGLVALEIIIDLPIGFPINNIISLSLSCSVLQGVAVCCRMLRCVAACCSVLQCVAVCHLLQYIAVRCSVLQSDAVCCSKPCVADSQELAHGSCVSSRGEGGGKTQESTSQDSLVRS